MSNEPPTRPRSGKGKSVKGEKAVYTPPATQLLKALEDMLHKRIARKKLEIHKYRERAETDRIWTEIDRDIALGAIRESLAEDD